MESVSDDKMVAAFALLRAKIYEYMENQEQALIWYEKAVQFDPYCHEALDRLVGGHLLTLEREVKLLDNLSLHEEDGWLHHLYATKLVAARSDSGHASSPTVQEVPWMVAARGDNREEDPTANLPEALLRNGSTLAAQSIRSFYEGDYERCYAISIQVLEDDPYHLPILPIHVASLVMLDRKNVVFYVAHQLINAYPSEAVAWFTVGCYYHMIKKYERARTFFQKAFVYDRNFAPAWIAFGHAFAYHDESDQALAAYRTASRLFPGSQLPWLFIGMEYVRTNSLQLAQQCLERAQLLMPTDPHVYNEMGVVAFHQRDYNKACDLLDKALRLSNMPHETFYSNLGHALLKCKQFDRALENFQKANRLNPRNASVISGIAFTYQSQNQLDTAIEYYHRALTMQRDDVFTVEMLKYAVQEAVNQPLNIN